MRISESLKLVGFFVLSACSTGCILPIPHTRVARPECAGFVSDSMTGRPIANAEVLVVYEGGTNITACTDSSGHWVIPSEKTWHAVLVVAPPSDISLLPFCATEYDNYPCEITIRADGYDKWKWTRWVDGETLEMLSKPIDGPTENPLPLVIDPKNVQLKPQSASTSRE